MNETIQAGTVDRPINDTTAPQTTTEPVGLQTGGEGAPQTIEGDQGSPQGVTEGGQQPTGDHPRRTKIPVDRDELLGLRSERRELRGQVSELRAMLEEMRAAQQQGARAPKETPQKGAAKFFDAPEEYLESLREDIHSLRDQFREELQSTRQQDVQTSQLHQQRADAVKLIHSQPNWSNVDDQELIDIIEENGLGALPPMQGAKAALAIFNQEKNIRDTSEKRQRATSMVGGPPSGAGSAKIWSKVEVDKHLDAWSINPASIDQKLMQEFKTASADGRIR